VDSTIFLLLLQDGLTTGAIYLLLAIGLLIVFSVSGVIFIPQGDFVSFAALGFAGDAAGVWSAPLRVDGLSDRI